MMEERGLGTKATRADIIQKLYYRGYVHGNPPEPSETGVKMYEGFKTYVPRVADSEMTAQLESEMDQIAQGEMTKDEVLTDSRDALRSAYDEMGKDVDVEDEDEPWRKFARLVWSGMDEDRILGPCVVCQEAGRKKEDGSPNMLRVIRAKKSGKSFVGCTGWDGDEPRLARLLRPDLPDAPAPLLRRAQARGDLHGLRAHPARLGRPEVQAGPPLEALLQRRLPLDGGDEAQARRARGRQGRARRPRRKPRRPPERQEGDEGKTRRRPSRGREDRGQRREAKAKKKAAKKKAAKAKAKAAAEPDSDE